MPLPIYLFILLELTFVAWADIRTNKIVNMWSILNIICFILLLFVVPELYFFRLETFLYSGVFLIVGFIFFLVKIMGGGDSKFLFTFFLIVPLHLHEMTFESLLISTILVGTFTFLTNVAKNFDKLINSIKIMDKAGIKDCFGTKFAFAPVILLAWIWLGWKIKDQMTF